jgi:hypothetical protein
MGVNPKFDHCGTQRRLFRRYRLSETVIPSSGEHDLCKDLFLFLAGSRFLQGLSFKAGLCIWLVLFFNGQKKIFLINAVKFQCF